MSPILIPKAHIRFPISD